MPTGIFLHNGVRHLNAALTSGQATQFSARIHGSGCVPGGAWNLLSRQTPAGRPSHLARPEEDAALAATWDRRSVADRTFDPCRGDASQRR